MLSFVAEKITSSSRGRYLLNKLSNNPEFGPLFDVMSNRVKAGLQRLRDMGYEPDWVVDAGAYKGEWTTGVLPVFPRAKFLMLEAQPEKQAYLDKVRAKNEGRVQYAIGLLGDKEADEVEFFLAETGSSRYVENTAFARERTVLPMTTLDSVFAKEEVAGSIFLKLDVQGAELDLLNGAGRSLSGANGVIIDAVLMEVSLAAYNEGSPRAAHVIAYMNDRGYELWDIWDMPRIPDKVGKASILAQADFVFVKSSSSLAVKTQEIVRAFGS